MSDLEYMDWPRYFHVAPNLLGEGSIIQPGNWGRILNMYRERDANSVTFREYVFEQVRASEFPNKPSRLNCMFLLRTLEEASLYKDNNSHLGVIYEVAANTRETEIHLGNYNFHAHLSLINLMHGMHQIAREYWAVDPTDSVEVLFPGSVVVVARH